jgi:phosphoserine phosphatase RsbU/P
MHSLFNSREVEPVAVEDPARPIFPKVEGGDLAAVYASKRVAGDFYDSLRVSPQRILFCLLDAAGRREDNRALILLAQQIFRASGEELFGAPDINESNAMTELSLRLNRGLIDHSKGVHPCPAFLACYHEQFGTLCYSNAGHTPGILRDATGITELASTGLPLGLFSHATGDAPTIGIEPGAALLLVSRGVIEHGSQNDKAAEEFGMNRVRELLQTATGDAKAICVSILDGVAKFSQESRAPEDRSALAFVRAA